MAADWRIPFNRPAMAGRELDYVRRAIEDGHISGGGSFTSRCQDLLRDVLGTEAVILTTSGTHALEMSAILLGIKPGDEVIMPSFTFVSTANAFALRGARIVFSDIRMDTLNMDEDQLPSLVTERTRAVVPVHYGGVGCEMDSISSICGPLGIPVVEDNAHGLFATYRGRKLGTMGRMAALSFHETKNITCGEGGALVVNDPSLVSAAEIVRDKGTDRSRFLRGEVDRYTWVSLGSSYQPSDMLAAYLLAQLEDRQKIWERRSFLWNRYMDGLAPLAAEHGIRLPAVPAHCSHSSHVFYLLMPDRPSRDGLMDGLRNRGILAVFHYQPLHLSVMARGEGHCPNTISAASRILRLPIYPGLTESEQDTVMEGVRETIEGGLR
ncbi:MAG: dTDP-4-amino-4,6-dideoxygalactose transaminase [Candidatus Fermentibacteraceae bacterium]|nr:dTDP-4-amino-4,6-dideoxygalactose transaminase [Candidatus Fermentibacteraceae bacterium]MBN2609084.1 dTDP-4-amino-4,6-dideoxygalactose transaminase [Candidatus Fermentibacteraceae bacterium]